MTLSQSVEHFLYTHAPNLLHKKQLLDLITAGEEAYLRRIAELEQDAAVKEFDKIVTESEVDCTSCYCNATPMPPCSFCTNEGQAYHNLEGYHHAVD